jgi:hypothetical protein
MDDVLKQKPLAAAIGAAASPLPVSPEEQSQRDAVVAELERLIGVARSGRFLAMIVSEEVENTFPAKATTGLWGDGDMLRLSAAQVVTMYAEREKVREESTILLPDPSPLIVPGVQS